VTNYTYYVYAYFPDLLAHMDLEIIIDRPLNWEGIEQVKTLFRDKIREKKIAILSDEPLFLKNIFLLSIGDNQNVKSN
jgi:hypothetical protein